MERTDLTPSKDRDKDGRALIAGSSTLYTIGQVSHGEDGPHPLQGQGRQGSFHRLLYPTQGQVRHEKDRLPLAPKDRDRLVRNRTDFKFFPIAFRIERLKKLQYIFYFFRFVCCPHL